VQENPHIITITKSYWNLTTLSKYKDKFFSRCYDFLLQEKRFFRRLCHFLTVDFVDKHSLEKVGYALLLLAIIQVVKTLHVFVLHLYFCSVAFDRFLNTTLQDRVLHRNCNSVCYSMFIFTSSSVYTSDGNSNCHHGHHRYCLHRFFKLR